jgi:protein TonB
MPSPVDDGTILLTAMTTRPRSAGVKSYLALPILFLDLVGCGSKPSAPTIVVSAPPMPPVASAGPVATAGAAVGRVLTNGSPAATDAAGPPPVPTGAPDDPNPYAMLVTAGEPPPKPSPPAPARRARRTSADRSCPFPPEADAAKVDEAVVFVSISVDAKGRPDAVSVLRDPGDGFGRAARACALRGSFVPAADEHGRPVSDTFKMRIQFTRPVAP